MVIFICFSYDYWIIIGFSVSVLINLEQSANYCNNYDINDEDYNDRPELILYEDTCITKVYKLFDDYPCNCRFFMIRQFEENTTNTKICNQFATYLDGKYNNDEVSNNNNYSYSDHCSWNQTININTTSAGTDFEASQRQIGTLITNILSKWTMMEHIWIDLDGIDVILILIIILFKSVIQYLLRNNCKYYY